MKQVYTATSQNTIGINKWNSTIRTVNRSLSNN